MNFKFFRKYKLLFIILLVASVLRLWNLQNMPPHLRNDEAALGYNAYSVLQTGRDEHGEFLPIIFQSFGDWKMGLYVYLTIPFIAIFGLNEFSVRLPSALAGIISVWLLYGVSLELFNKKRLACISSALLAISPLFVPFSRGAWEVNVSFALTLAGIYFFLTSLKNNKLLLLSALFFGLTLICSHGAKFSTPVIITILVLTFYRELKKISWRRSLWSLSIVFLFAVPVIFSFTQGKVARLTTLSIFSYPQGGGYISEIFHFIRSILSRLLDLYSTNTLFISGDNSPQHGAPNAGPFLLIDAFILLLGFIRLSKIGLKEQTLFIWSTLLLLGFSSALTIEKVNFERILVMFVSLLMIGALGLDSLWVNVKKRYKSASKLLFLFGVLYLINYIYFLDQYFIHGPKKNDAWQYGYKQIVQKITPIQSKYQQIIVQQSYEHPYIFFLFFQQYNPSRYQAKVAEVFIPNKEGKDMGLISGLDNIKFENINWENNKPRKGILFVMPAHKLAGESKFYSSYRILDEVKDLNGFPLFKVVETI